MARIDVESIEKSFDWLVLLATVLSGVILAFWMWLSPVSILTVNFTAQLMSSLTFPLIILLFPVFWQHISVKKNIIYQLFSWGALIFLLTYDVLLFVTLEAVILTRNPLFTLVFGISGYMIFFGLLQIPFKQVMARYKESDPENKYWKKGTVKIWIPYILGILIIGLIVVISIVPLV